MIGYQLIQQEETKGQAHIMEGGYSVVIPSAILVPESLRSVGNLPAIVYPLSEGTVFDALYAMYRDADEIVIVLREGSDEAHERICDTALSNVRLVEMPSAGDLASTVQFGLEHLLNKSIPVVVNFGSQRISVL